MSRVFVHDSFSSSSKILLKAGNDLIQIKKLPHFSQNPYLKTKLSLLSKHTSIIFIY